ncbi:hypothetical protein [Microbacterium sp.]|nr:hypothetical protein [Microbacterium sp.]MDP3952187.1 hypothetical protein [Microbacterium sp.]
MALFEVISYNVFMEPWFDDVDDRPRDAAFFVESALDDLQCADIDLNR